MSDLQISTVGTINPGASSAALPPKAAGAGFGETLRQAVDQVNRLQQDADSASQAFALGQSLDVASTLIAVEKANITFQLTLQIRNKLLEAYQEIMRMPI